MPYQRTFISSPLYRTERRFVALARSDLEAIRFGDSGKFLEPRHCSAPCFNA